MLTKQQLYLVKELFLTITNAEKQLEIIRQDLAQNALFSLKPIFLRLDQSRQGFIDSGDLMLFFVESQIKISSKEVIYILKWLDKNRDSRVTYDDLCKALLPRDDPRQRVVAALREPYNIPVNMSLPKQIENGLVVYLETLLEGIRQQQEIKLKLIYTQNFNIFNLFHMIDQNNKGFINQQDLQAFLKSNGLDGSDFDVKFFFFIADLDEDGKISCQELIEVLVNSDIQTSFPHEKRYLYFSFNFFQSFSKDLFRYDGSSITNKSQSLLKTNANSYFLTPDKPTTNNLTKMKNYHSTYTLKNNQTQNSPILIKENQFSQSTMEEYKPMRNYLEQQYDTKQQKTPETRNEKQQIYEEFRTPERQPQKQLAKTPDIGMRYQNQAKTPEKLAQTNRTEDYISYINSIKRTNTLKTSKPINRKIINENQESPTQLDNFLKKLPNQIKVIENRQNFQQYYNFFRLLLKQLLLFRELEEIKRQLALKKEFNLLDTFRIFDLQEKGEINQKQFQYQLFKC